MESDEVDVDDLIVKADTRSRRGWRERALGASPAEIVAATPRVRDVNVGFPIPGLRLYQAWCAEHRTTVQDHIRRCVALDLAAAGWTEDEIAALQPSRRQRLR